MYNPISKYKHYKNLRKDGTNTNNAKVFTGFFIYPHRRGKLINKEIQSNY